MQGSANRHGKCEEGDASFRVFNECIEYMLNCKYVSRKIWLSVVPSYQNRTAFLSLPMCFCLIPSTSLNFALARPCNNYQHFFFSADRDDINYVFAHLLNHIDAIIRHEKQRCHCGNNLCMWVRVFVRVHVCMCLFHITWQNRKFYLVVSMLKTKLRIQVTKTKVSIGAKNANLYD